MNKLTGLDDDVANDAVPGCDLDHHLTLGREPESEPIGLYQRVHLLDHSGFQQRRERSELRALVALTA